MMGKIRLWLDMYKNLLSFHVENSRSASHGLFSYLPREKGLS